MGCRVEWSPVNKENIMDIQALEKIARSLVEGGKGILAADESTGTIAKRFEKINVEPTEANRRAYRELLFTTPGFEKYVSGVILFDETIRQKTAADVMFSFLLQEKKVTPGIKVDQGTVPLPNGEPNEVMTAGLEGLGERLMEYYALGARFAKWRAVIKIGQNMPTDLCLETNANLLAKYARLCQEAGIVPIVEPEVLMDGAHSIETCFDVTKRTLEKVFAALQIEGAALSGLILKPNMVIGGSEGPKAAPETVAEMTMRCFRETVPAAVPGIVFLSGGQSEVEATANLQAINAVKGDAPWKLSFSYGRALQASTLETWSGKPENISQAQAEFLKRAELNHLATKGEYTGE